MRGTPYGVIFVAWIMRIIPANAGNTHPPSTPCGCECGSSPRMRGTRRIDDGFTFHIRIIPADAGNTHTGTAPMTSTKDHPRGCGEHAKAAWYGTIDCPSSPRMRGTRPTVCRNTMMARIIPADAGNTFCWRWLFCLPGDHPRGCGEHGFILAFRLIRPGSSPRMRGTPGF